MSEYSMEGQVPGDAASSKRPSAYPPSSPGPAPAGLHKVASNSAMQEDDEDITFESSSHEAAYFRDKYRRVADFLEETRAELDEFQLSSKELEDELEKELAATEKQQAELKDRIKRLEAEKEEWKAKHISAQKMHSSTVSAMQREMDNLRSERDKTLVALRDLEMGNDELERNERVAVSSLLDLESKYNRAIEEKTLLEQEIVQKVEVEEDSQRLKDELRDANDQISILRDQLARNNLPTPPSSISVPLSPSRSVADLPEPETGDISTTTVGPPSSPSHGFDTPTPGLPPKTGSNGTLSRSSTLSNIPTISPTLRRATTQIPGTPLGGMSRSHTARNLIGESGIPGSPSLARSRSGIPQPSPLRVPSEPKYPLSRAAKMVTDLRRRIKATDDRMGGKATRRAVSNPTSDIVSAASKTGQSKPVNSRLAALANDPLHTPQAGNSTLSVLSPNGWILVDEPENADQANPTGRAEPTSPIETTHMHHQPRAVSGASTATTSRGLPSRPGIPSPLMTLAASRQTASSLSHGTPTPKNSTIPITSSNLAKSTHGLASGPGSASRPPSRSALSQSSRLPSRTEAPSQTAAARPASRSAMAPSNRSVSRTGMRPMSRATSNNMMSPSSYNRSGARSPPSSSNTFQSLSASVSTSTRPTTATGTRTPNVGRGPPPSAMSSAAQRRQLSMSASSSTPAVSSIPVTSAIPSRIPMTGAQAAADIRRRRSSMGPGKEIPETAVAGGEEGYFNLTKLQSQSQAVPGPGRTPPATGLAHSHGPGGKGRPASVPHFGTPPPEMPRIPSVHLREKRRTIQQG